MAKPLSIRPVGFFSLIIRPFLKNKGRQCLPLMGIAYFVRSIFS